MLSQGPYLFNHFPQPTHVDPPQGYVPQDQSQYQGPHLERVFEDIENAFPPSLGTQRRGNTQALTSQPDAEHLEPMTSMGTLVSEPQIKLGAKRKGGTMVADASPRKKRSKHPKSNNEEHPQRGENLTESEDANNSNDAGNSNDDHSGGKVSKARPPTTKQSPSQRPIKRTRRR